MRWSGNSEPPPCISLRRRGAAPGSRVGGKNEAAPGRPRRTGARTSEAVGYRFSPAGEEDARRPEAAYIDEYLAHHTRARLGVNDDKRKGQLLGDERLRRVQRLTTIDLLPRQQLNNFQNRLAGLKSCFALTDQDLDATAECPHCAFRPSTEHANTSASCELSTLDNELDSLLSTWTETLLGNLDDPTTKEQLTLLRRDQRDLVDEFISSASFPLTWTRFHRCRRAGPVRPLEGSRHLR